MSWVKKLKDLRCFLAQYLKNFPLATKRTNGGFLGKCRSLDFSRKTECCQAEDQLPTAACSWSVPTIPAASSANCYFPDPVTSFTCFCSWSLCPLDPVTLIHGDEQTDIVPAITGLSDTIHEQTGLDFSPGRPLSRESLSGKEKVCIHTLFRVWSVVLPGTLEKMQSQALPQTYCLEICIFMRSQVCNGWVWELGLYTLRALPRVDEAVDHAEVVERAAKGGCSGPTGAGGGRGRSRKISGCCCCWSCDSVAKGLRAPEWSWGNTLPEDTWGPWIPRGGRQGARCVLPLLLPSAEGAEAAEEAVQAGVEESMDTPGEGSTLGVLRRLWGLGGSQRGRGIVHLAFHSSRPQPWGDPLLLIWGPHGTEGAAGFWAALPLPTEVPIVKHLLTVGSGSSNCLSLQR